MKALNCRLGDLAVTVRAELPENIGIVVRIVGNHGPGKWFGLRGRPHLWEVEVAAKEARLVYEESDGSRRITTSGLAPDAILRPIAPLRTADAVTKSLEEYDHV